MPPKSLRKRVESEESSTEDEAKVGDIKYVKKELFGKFIIIIIIIITIPTLEKELKIWNLFKNCARKHMALKHIC